MSRGGESEWLIKLDKFYNGIRIRFSRHRGIQFDKYSFHFHRNHCGIHDQAAVTCHQTGPANNNLGSPRLQLRPVLPVGVWDEWPFGKREEFHSLWPTLVGIMGILKLSLLPFSQEIF